MTPPCPTSRSARALRVLALLLAVVAAAPGARAQPPLDWGALQNPVLSRPDRMLKDHSVVLEGGYFWIFPGARLDSGSSSSDQPPANPFPWKRVYRTRDFKTYTEFDAPYYMGSPDVTRWDGVWHKLSGGYQDEEAIVLQTSTDLRTWSPAYPSPVIIQEETGAGRTIDGVLARTGHTWHVGFKGNNTRPGEANNNLLVKHSTNTSPQPLASVRWTAAGYATEGFENFQWLKMGERWFMVATEDMRGTPYQIDKDNKWTGYHEPWLFPMVGDGSRNGDWLNWGEGHHLIVKTEGWNTAMRANAGYLLDLRDRDGYYYLFYAGADDSEAFGRRGNASIGVSRSLDLYHWDPAGEGVGEYTYEAEGAMNATDSGHGTTRVEDVGGASADNWVVYNTADAAGAWVEYRVRVPAAGTFRVQVSGRTFRSRGQFRLRIDGTVQGGVVDQYAGAGGEAVHDLGVVTLSAGTHTVRFENAGRNAASSGRTMGLDALVFKRTSGGGGGIVRFRSRQTGKVMRGAGTADGAPVTVHALNAGWADETWELVAGRAGSQKIRNRATGLFVRGLSPTDGDCATLDSDHEWQSLEWYPEAGRDGSTKFRSRQTGKYLRGLSATDGGCVTVHEGRTWASQEWDVETVGAAAARAAVGAELAEGAPGAFAVRGPFPNPLTSGAAVEVDLPENADVRVVVLDLLGRRVLELLAQPMRAGARQRLHLDASALSAGVYLYHVTAQSAVGTSQSTGRLTVVK